MTGLLRRLRPRYHLNLPVELGIVEDNGPTPPVITATATMINISRVGCCIAIGTPLIGGDHLFYKTLHSDRWPLWLCVQGENRQKLIFHTRSLWMNGGTFAGRQAFTIGLQFSEKLTDLSFFLNVNNAL